MLTSALGASRTASARRAAILLGCALGACMDLELASTRLHESDDALRGPMADADGGGGKDVPMPASSAPDSSFEGPPGEGGGRDGTSHESISAMAVDGADAVSSVPADAANSNPVGDAAAFPPDAGAVCDAGVCRAPLGLLGATCSSGSDCESSFCGHGVCCEADCSGTCQLCSATGHCYEVPRLNETCRAATDYACDFENKDIPELTRLSCVDVGASPELTLMYALHATTSEGDQILHLLRVDHADELWMPIRFTAFGFNVDGNEVCSINPPRTVYPPGYCPPGIDCPTSQTVACPASLLSMSIYSYRP